MRILVISHEYPPLGTGAANALTHLLPCWGRSGCDVALLTSHLQGLPLVETDGNVTIHRIQCCRKKRVSPSAAELLFFLFKARAAASRLVDKWNPDVAVAFFTIPAGSIARHACRNRVPYVVALRGSDVPGYDRKRFGGLLSLTKPWVRRIWSDAAAVVANGTWLRDLAGQTAKDQVIQIIGNGVDTTPFADSECDRTELNRASHTVRLLYAGQLTRRKGIDIVLNTIADLPWTRLWIAGDGPQRGELVTLAKRLSIADRITWYGHVEKETLIPLYAGADLFVMPSEAEGMSNSVLEAMAAGLPIITTTAAGRDLIQDGVGGCLIDRNVDALKQMLVLLRNETVRREMGERNRAEARHRSWDHIASQWLTLLTESVRSSGLRGFTASHLEESLPLSRGRGEIIRVGQKKRHEREAA